MKKPPLKSPNAPSTGYLLATLFLAGVCSLILEVAGARLISPFFGSSIFVWSAMITVTLVALATGYAWGGRLADRSPYLTLYARLLTAAGLTVATIPFLRVPALKAAAPLGVRLGALAGAAMLLGPALALLGSIGPVAVRLTAPELNKVGRSAGDAWAVSTAGSVVGAALAGFWLIPNFPLTRVILGVALVLLALGAWGSWLSSRAIPIGQLAACAACVGLALRPLPASRWAAETRESAYGRIQILQGGGKRYLLVNGTSQSIMRVADGRADSQYIRALEWALALRPKSQRALVLGLGAGLLPTALERRGLIADTVEIDPEIESAARRWFAFSPAGAVTIADGRAGLDSAGGPWDLVFLDAFGAESPPTHLFTTEAFAALRGRLNPDGVLAVNLVCSVHEPGAKAWRAVYRTLKTAFPNVRAFVASDPNEGLANVLFFASDGPVDAPARAAEEPVRAEIAKMLSRELSPAPSELAAVPTLTDDHAPLDALLADTAKRWRGLLQQAMPEVLLD